MFVWLLSSFITLSTPSSDHPSICFHPIKETLINFLKDKVARVLYSSSSSSFSLPLGFMQQRLQLASSFSTAKASSTGKDVARLSQYNTDLTQIYRAFLEPLTDEDAMYQDDL